MATSTTSEAGGQAALFELWLGPLGPRELTVVSFHGREELSRAFRFDVVVAADADLLGLDPALLGAPATLSLRVPDEPPRVVQGIVSTVEARPAVPGADRQRYRVRIVPRLWLLTRRRTSRIFQDKTLVEIVDAVLTEHRVERRWKLARAPKARSYCVQYRETDHEFVARLLAEEGIFFYFEAPAGALLEALGDDDAGGDAVPRERVVFCDQAQGCPPLGLAPLPRGQGGDAPDDGGVVLPAPRLAYRAVEPGQVGGEYVHGFSFARSIRSSAVHLRDFDFERPLLDLRAGASVAGPNGSPSGPSADGPAMFSAAQDQGIDPTELEIYEHHADYAETSVSPEQARVHVEQHRARALLARGESTCRRLSPGYRFQLDGEAGQLAGEYTVVRVTHEGVGPAYAAEGKGGRALVYQNRFACVPALVPYRPRRPRRELSNVLESAIVVGPAGEAIHTDRLGRVKVQFHWDREGRRDETSSCWIRVLHGWAGASWGMQFIPRVGMEVLVSVIGGDEDRPVVMGAAYNAAHPPPFLLPQSKTRSGLRTQSVGGDGYNELSFEDASGGELVYLKAQRDLTEQVRRDHTLQIEGEQTIEVARSQHQRVGEERHDSVGGDETRHVRGAQRTSIGGDRSETVAGHRTDTIAQNSLTEVRGSVVLNTGNETVIVEGASSLNVGSEDAPAARSVIVHGQESHDATKAITLRSETRILLAVGDTTVALSADGIRIESKTIVIKAREKLLLLGDGPGIELAREADILADTIKLFSKGGSLELDAQAAHLDGPLVKLNCGAGDAPELDDDEEKPKTKPFKWTCLDALLEPYKNKTYRLTTQGFRCKGTTDGSGVIEKDLPEDAFSAELTLWTETFPEGERLHYSIRLGDLPPASSVYGAKIRLKNLGYYLGPEDDEASPELASALIAFQDDFNLAASGVLDGETSSKLGELHPA